MLKLMIENQDFLQELKNSEISRAFELDLESIAFYEYYANAHNIGVFRDIAAAKSQLKALFSYEGGKPLFIDCTQQDAFLILLANELKIVQAYKIAASVCANESFKDLIFRLWASSVNEYQVALRKGLVTNDFSVDSLVNNFLKDILK